MHNPLPDLLYDLNRLLLRLEDFGLVSLRKPLRIL